MKKGVRGLTEPRDTLHHFFICQRTEEGPCQVGRTSKKCKGTTVASMTADFQIAVLHLGSLELVQAPLCSG